MKGILAFVKKHVFCSIVAAPVILVIIMLVVGWPLLFVTAFTGRGWFSQMYASVFFLLILLLVFVYPLILTVCNVYFIVKRHLGPFEKSVSALSELSTIVLGFVLSWLYITEVTDIVFADWPRVLYNGQVHTPIATWTFPTIAVMAGIGIVGYLILRMVPLKETPPLVTVLSMSAMYIGCLMCILWTVQTCVPDRGGIYLFLFPVNCVLIAVKVIRGLLWQWQELHPGEVGDGPDRLEGSGLGRLESGGSDRLEGGGPERLEGSRPERIESGAVTARFRTILQNSGNWPWLALLFMLPLLGILIMILTLFGQKPDSIIKAWTQTSQWSLSQKVSPQNLTFDEHYLCTVAAGGHPGVVRPTRLGIRHGHQVIVNRQLCVANAFEQILMERMPRLHRLVRRGYDRYGFPLARHIKSRQAADVVYILMKPLEWFFLAVIYLCDVHPEDRIAMQYITPVDRDALGSGF